MHAGLMPSPAHSLAPDRSGDYDHVRRAIEFLSAAWREQPSLETLAAHVGLSPAHMQRLFKRWCGLSPKEFVQAITYDHARGLLEGSASILEAAHEVGLSGGGRLHDLLVTYEAMTPGDLKRRGDGLALAYGFHPSPFGDALVIASERGITGLAFCDGEAERPAALADMARRWPRARLTEDPGRTAPLLARIFGTGRSKAGQPVRLVLIGSDFEVRVWDALLKVPTGRAVSYSDIAGAIGTPTAVRAVGSAVGRNPISFVVPCHRALRRDGNLGGYHWGITRKKAIIGWEAGRLRHPDVASRA